MTHNRRKPDSQVAESVLKVREKKGRAKARQKAAQQAEREAALPLTDAQRKLLATARTDILNLSQAIARAQRAHDFAARDEMMDRKKTIIDFTLAIVRQAEEAAASETARIMMSRPRGR